MHTGWERLNKRVDALVAHCLDHVFFGPFVEEYADSYTPKALRLPDLPDEILLEIFRLFTFYFHSSPWHLTLVCRSWRYLALNAAVLWTHISIEEPEPPNLVHELILKELWSTPSGVQVSSTGDLHVCRSLAALEDTFRRAQSARVDLYINISQFSRNDFWRVPMTCLRQVRVKSLYLGRLPSSLETFFLEEIVRNIDILSLETLDVSILLSKEVSPVLSQLTQQSAKIVTRLSIPVNFFTTLPRGKLADQSPLQSLTLLGRRGYQIDSIRDLARYKDLRSFSLYQVTFLSCAAADITLDRLECLVVECNPYHLPKFHLPALKSLYLTSTSSEGCSCRRPNPTFEFPVMTDLWISMKAADTAWIRQLVAPQLQQLSYHSTIITETPLELPPMPQIERIYIGDCQVCKATFKSVPKVKHSTIYLGLSTAQIQWEDCVDSIFTDTPCPDLRTLTLSSINFSYNSSLDLYLKCLMRDLRQTQPLFEHIRVSWDDYGPCLYTTDL